MTQVFLLTTYYSSQIRSQYGSSDLLANWIPEVHDKEDAKTRYGYFHGYDDRVQLQFNYSAYAKSNMELGK